MVKPVFKRKCPFDYLRMLGRLARWESQIGGRGGGGYKDDWYLVLETGQQTPSS